MLVSCRAYKLVGGTRRALPQSCPQTPVIHAVSRLTARLSEYQDHICRQQWRRGRHVIWGMMWCGQRHYIIETMHSYTLPM